MAWYKDVIPSPNKFGSLGSRADLIRSVKGAGEKQARALMGRSASIIKEASSENLKGAAKSLIKNSNFENVKNKIINNESNVTSFVKDQVAKSRHLRVSSHSGDRLPTSRYYTQYADFYRLSNDVMEIDAKITAKLSTIGNIIGLTQLGQIACLPPLSDNVVDPPPFLGPVDLNGNYSSFGSNMVGQEYVDRVLSRGQFLVLVPLEMKPMLSEYILKSHLLTNKSLGLLEFIKESATDAAATVDTFLNKIDNRMGISTYGYSTKINTRRYWMAVGAHMKVAFHALGIDPLDQNTDFSTQEGREYQGVLANYLPLYMIQRILDNGIWRSLQNVIGSGIYNGPTNASEGGTVDLSQANDNLKTFIASAAKDVGKDALGDLKNTKAFKAVAGKVDKYKSMGLQAKDKLLSNIPDKYKVAAMKSLHTIVANGSSIMSKHTPANVFSNDGEIVSLYDASFRNMLSAVTNIDLYSEDLSALNLPFVTFYCNGAVERSMSFSLSSDKSKIASSITDVGAKSVSGLLNLSTGFIKGAFGLTGNQAQDGVIQSAMDGVKDTLTSQQDVFQELVYHKEAQKFDGLLTNTYVPKVITEGTGNVSYNISLRSVATGSDKFSIARLFWDVSLLLPMVLQTTKPKMPFTVPRSPMYCGAFIKGVCNLPRGYISSLSIKTDPAFQTTNGVPLEINMELTIEPLYTLPTMLDFTDNWGGVSGHDLLAAMWNPMSSFNIIATLAGTNTVLTKVKSNLFKFYIGAPLTNVYRGFVKGFLGGGYFSTMYADWRRGYNVEDNYSYHL